MQLLLVDRWAPAPPDSDYARSGDPAANASIDEHAECFDRAKQRLEFATDRICWFTGESELAADMARATGEEFDFVFLDADHSYRGRLDDLCCWFPLVKVGGLVAGGLLQSSFGGDSGRRALWAFLDQWPVEPSQVLLGPAQTWAFVKP